MLTTNTYYWDFSSFVLFHTFGLSFKVPRISFFFFFFVFVFHYFISTDKLIFITWICFSIVTLCGSSSKVQMGFLGHLQNVFVGAPTYIRYGIFRFYCLLPFLRLGTTNTSESPGILICEHLLSLISIYWFYSIIHMLIIEPIMKLILVNIPEVCSFCFLSFSSPFYYLETGRGEETLEQY